MDKKQNFISAIKTHQALIFKIASVYTDAAEDRKDLVQEIVFNLWKSFDSFNQQSALSTWIYRVAMNVAIYHLKTSKRKIHTVPIAEQDLTIQETDNHEPEEQLKILRQHLARLNLLDKGIVMLYLENKSHQEIAAITGISVSNVGTRLSRIKERLRQQIINK